MGSHIVLQDGLIYYAYARPYHSGTQGDDYPRQLSDPISDAPLIRFDRLTTSGVFPELQQLKDPEQASMPAGIRLYHRDPEPTISLHIPLA